MGKRKRGSKDRGANDVGIGQTLALLKSPDPGNASPEAKTASSTDANDDGWTTVKKNGRPAKKQKNKEKKGDEDSYPSIYHSYHARLQTHIKVGDLQSLVLYLLADGFAPQWVAVKHHKAISQVVVLMVPGLVLDMFNGKIPLESRASTKSSQSNKIENPLVSSPGSTEHDEVQTKSKRLHISPDDYYPASLKPERLPEVLKPLANIFPHIWPIVIPADYKGRMYFRIHSPMHAMLTSPIPKTQEEKRLKKDPNHKGPAPQNTKNWRNERTRITKYIADLMEQQECEFTVHPALFTTPEAKEKAHQIRLDAKQTSEYGWVNSNVESLEEGEVPEKDIEQGSITAGRHIVTLDCEMCKAEDDTLVLTRASAIDWDGEVIFDELVKPDVLIKDYLTQWSGITPAMLKDVTTTLSDVQQRLLKLITPYTILVGHSLNSDLNALKLTHPFLIDTGIIYPHPRGPPYRQSLKWLSQKYLTREIQKNGSRGHDSLEDARACLDLLKQKCERGPSWGTNDANGESIFKRLGRNTRPRTTNETRTGAVVDWGEPSRGHGGQAQVSIGCQSDAEVVAGITSAVQGHAVGKGGTTDKVDFVWGRLRELELVRGWWEQTKTSDYEETRQKALQRLGRADEDDELTGSSLGEAVSSTVTSIVDVYNSLPPCTAFIVYSGTGDPRELHRLQQMRQQFQREYATKNWDSLSVKWTDTENQALSEACKVARDGIGFVTVK